jgi:hypothetical protein
MKNLAIVFLLAIACFSFTGTRTWVIVNPEIVNDIAPYEEALSKSSLDKYRYQDKRYTMHFENGLNIELLSANELNAQGISYKTDHIRTAEPEFDTKPVFRLTQDGYLVEVQTRTKVK